MVVHGDAECEGARECSLGTDAHLQMPAATLTCNMHVVPCHAQLQCPASEQSAATPAAGKCCPARLYVVAGCKPVSRHASPRAWQGALGIPVKVQFCGLAVHGFPSAQAVQRYLANGPPLGGASTHTLPWSG